MSLKRRSQEADVSITAAGGTTTFLKLQTYWTRVVNALKERDLVARINLCDWFLRSVHDGEVDLRCSDKAWFSLRGEVSNRYWSAENSRFIDELLILTKELVFDVR
jgi:hypothetical protein